MITIDLVQMLRDRKITGLNPVDETWALEVSETTDPLCVAAAEEIERLRNLKMVEAVDLGYVVLKPEKYEALKRERDEAYERAAQVCDEQESLQYETSCDECASQARRDAYFIRALKAKP